MRAKFPAGWNDWALAKAAMQQGKSERGESFMSSVGLKGLVVIPLGKPGLQGP